MISLLLMHDRNEPMTGQVASAIERIGGDFSLTVVDTPEQAMAHADAAEVLLSFFATAPLIEAAKRLRWIQALGSGVDGFLRHPNLAPEVILTNAAGIHAKPVSEAILSLMFALVRDLPQAIRCQQSHSWGGWMPRLLGGSHVLIIGVGHIGAATGAKCAALGATVAGISKRSDLPEGFSFMYGHDQLHEKLAEADFVVLTAPLSAQTVGMIDETALSRMKPTAYLVNTARAGLIDDEALVSALKSHAIAGAALDVFTVEPLPPDSAYWDLPNVIVTPHRSGYHPGYGEDVARIVAGNLERYAAGRTDELVNRLR